MAYEKADFYAAYGFYAVDPVTRIRFARATSPDFIPLTDYNAFDGITLRLHYHPLVYRREALRKAQLLIDAVGITAADSLIIVGGAFGWLGEALVSLTGCSAVSIDLSQYVQDTKDLSPDDELIESIQASGYDHTLVGSVGEMLFNTFTDPVPRASISVLLEDLSSQKSKNTVKKALPRNPTRVITEEVWQILSQAEKDQYTSAADSFGVPMTHIIDGVII